MIIGKEIEGKDRIVVEFKKDIFISSFSGNLKSLITFTDKTEAFQDKNGELDLDKDYDTKDMTFKSLDPDVVLEFSDPRSIRNLILILEQAETNLINQYPKRKSRKG